jgi:oligoendopeptidase F
MTTRLSWVMIEQEPGLAPFRRLLERLVRERPHVRSAEVEQLLAETMPLAQAPATAFTLLDNADIRYGTVTDIDGTTVELTKGRYQLLLERRERRVRQEAYQVFHAPYIAHRHTLAALLSAANQRDTFYARARRYESALAAALHPDNIPLEVYTTLIDLVRQHRHLLQRYLAVRKRVLGLERLRTYDLYVPLVERADHRYTYAEARELVLAALRPLGPEYVEPLREGLASRWVDVHETIGKRSGGYSLGVYGVHPYILLNWNGTLREVFTLAHEVGHAMHSYFSSRAQPHPTAEYTIFVAEVASTFNERLLTHALLERATDARERAALVNDALDTFRIALFRQTLFAEFELLTHQAVERGEGLSADGLCELYGRLISEYYGPDLEVDEEVRHEWSRGTALLSRVLRLPVCDRAGRRDGVGASRARGRRSGTAAISRLLGRRVVQGLAGPSARCGGRSDDTGTVPGCLRDDGAGSGYAGAGAAGIGDPAARQHGALSGGKRRAGEAHKTRGSERSRRPP